MKEIKEKVEERLLEAIKDLTMESVELGSTSTERMQVTQAALNLSHAYATLRNS